MFKITDCIGNTPLIALDKRITKCDASIMVKLEEYNWGGSVKSRVAYQMIVDAEKSGRIPKNPNNVTIIEATGGNTGIGLAQMCAFRGYKCILVVPDNYSKVRVNILKRLGADVKLSDHLIGNDSHIKMVEELLLDNPSYIHLNQFSNDANPRAQYLGTGQEILKQFNEKIDAVVAGIGSGGTISGVGKALKEHDHTVKIYGVQPKGCDVLKGFAIPHIIQGIAIGQLSKVLNPAIIDGIVDVEENSILNMIDELAKNTGLYLGYSSIANIIGAINIAKAHPQFKNIITIAPDGGRNY